MTHRCVGQRKTSKMFVWPSFQHRGGKESCPSNASNRPAQGSPIVFFSERVCPDPLLPLLLLLCASLCPSSISGGPLPSFRLRRRGCPARCWCRSAGGSPNVRRVEAGSVVPAVGTEPPPAGSALPAEALRGGPSKRSGGSPKAGWRWSGACCCRSSPCWSPKPASESGAEQIGRAAGRNCRALSWQLVRALF